MDIKRIVLNEVSYFGPGARSILPEEIKRRGFKKSLIVTDKDLIKYHVVNKVTDHNPIASYGIYTPSTSAKEGTYIAFGVEVA